MAHETPATSDSAEAFEAEETSHTIPRGWIVLALALVAWGAVYLWKYSPALGGWSQASEYEQSVATVEKE